MSGSSYSASGARISARKGLAVQNRAAFIKILAEQRAGALLKQVERRKGGRGKGDKDKKGIRATLAHSEIPETTAKR